MGDLSLSILLASIVAGAAPIVFAAVGETITEKAGVVNLSLDGSILLSAMVAFVTAYLSHSLALGFIAGAFTGALVAAIVGVFSIYLGQSQLAVGFVLTLTARDLAYFFGNPYARLYGPQAGPLPIPFLHKIPLIGQALFLHSAPIYLSMFLIVACWWYINRTPMGLSLRAVGEHPQAAYARGADTQKIQMCCVILGGLLVGLAGATFSLYTKPGWGRPQGAEGTGWIALAIVIFGGWHPVKAALGAYLFAFLQVISIQLQGLWPSVPTQVFNVAPFPLMIFTLVLMHLAKQGSEPTARKAHPWVRRLVSLLSGQAPAALGKSFRPE